MTPFLLDTSVLIHWTRDSRQAQAIDATFNLSASRLRPLICAVTLGEMQAFSQSLNWGPSKKARLQQLTRQLVVVDILDARVLDAYAALQTLAQSRGWALFNHKNDLWIAAAAKATSSHLLTMDHDFLPLRGEASWTVTVLDATTGMPLP